MRPEYWGSSELCTVWKRGLQVTPVHNGTAPDIIYRYLASPIIRLLVKLITLFAVALHYTGSMNTGSDGGASENSDDGSPFIIATFLWCENSKR